MKSRNRKSRIPDCHPDRKHRALGKCSACYFAMPHLKEKRRERSNAWYEKNASNDPDWAKNRTKKWRDANKAESKEIVKNWRERNREKYLLGKRKSRDKRIGWSLERFETLLKDQKGLCAICSVLMEGRGHKMMSRDHCHATKTPRKILCAACNISLGFYEKHLRPRGLVFPAFEEYLLGSHDVA